MFCTQISTYVYPLNSIVHVIFTELVGFQIRPLASTDYRRGYLAVLSILTSSPDPGEAAWVNHFNVLRSIPSTYYSLVIVDKQTDKIVGLGTVVMEHKFQRGLSRVGHIEDIAVDEKQQGKKLGLRIIQALTCISENNGAYKTILNCSEKNIRTSLFVVPESHFLDNIVQRSTKNAASRRKSLRWSVF